MGRLPNFLIVGAAKCGTTSLAQYLGAHPQVFVPADKELDFFSRDDLWARGADWYAEHFAAAGDAVAVGEATPSYVFFPWSVQRIAELLPGVRVIVCLRDPVERAYSHYLHWVERHVRERRDFRQAVEDELRAGDLQERERPDDDPPYFGYVARGRYLPQLERLQERFGADAVHVVLLDDLERDPAGTYAAVCAFLGVDPAFRPRNLGERANAYHTFRPAWLFRFMVRHDLFRLMPKRLARYVALEVMGPRERPVPPMDDRARALLAAAYRDDNARLAAWLGRDLSPWTS